MTRETLNPAFDYVMALPVESGENNYRIPEINFKGAFNL